MIIKLVFNLIHSCDLLYVHDHVYSPIQISNDITMIIQGNQNNNFICMDPTYYQSLYIGSKIPKK